MLIIIILVIGLLAQLIFPWWIIAVVAFFFSFWQATTAGHGFIAGFVGIGLGWLGASLLSHIRTGGLLTQKIAALLSLPNSWLLVFLTAIIGALVGGLSGLAGYWGRRTLSPKIRSRV